MKFDDSDTKVIAVKSKLNELFDIGRGDIQAQMKSGLNKHRETDYNLYFKQQKCPQIQVMGTVDLVTHGIEKRRDERKTAEAERQKNEVFLLQSFAGTAAFYICKW